MALALPGDCAHAHASSMPPAPPYTPSFCGTDWHSGTRTKTNPGRIRGQNLNSCPETTEQIQCTIHGSVHSTFRHGDVCQSPPPVPKHSTQTQNIRNPIIRFHPVTPRDSSTRLVQNLPGYVG
ncbi:hypothetical protein DPEC_G00172420 [Dallia pectoralis]|uniref:Uncharacterized protein n=1 Tax=Dallia pectoralis TaxID=75939 RepID=A0ACC2GDD3_DALPE|nr:hypothetical protein DPEC_G00172420 [Dallia pectoralis]